MSIRTLLMKLKNYLLPSPDRKERLSDFQIEEDDNPDVRASIANLIDWWHSLSHKDKFKLILDEDVLPTDSFITTTWHPRYTYEWMLQGKVSEKVIKEKWQVMSYEMKQAALSSCHLSETFLDEIWDDGYKHMIFNNGVYSNEFITRHIAKDDKEYTVYDIIGDPEHKHVLRSTVE